jgi:hypothetical protein
MIEINETLQKFPFLTKFENEQREIENIFSELYDLYMHQEKISTPKMSMFLKNAAFLYFLSKNISPRVIFDMGSGFSTIVFNAYASNHDCKVYTTDTSDEWLFKTKKFIDDYCEKTKVKYVNWDNVFDLLKTIKSDLIFYGLYGKSGIREKIYQTLVANQPKSMYLLDDMHRTDYVHELTKIDGLNNRTLYSLEDITIDETGIRFMAISIAFE